MFGLVDCNNFFASCERVFRPDLDAKPIVVLSNNDGCVIARSNESKALNIPMGAPAYQYKELFKKYNVAVFSCNFALYGDLSNRIMNILRTHCFRMEQYSIDEAFLDFSGCKIEGVGLKIKTQVLKWTGVPVSVGFAPTKTLAKLANRIAKKFPKETEGVYVIDSQEKIIKALKWLKIEDVWGIGRKYSQKLRALNITKAYDFTLLEDNWIKANMSVVGLRIKKELQGKSVLDFQELEPRKNISVTRTFDKNYIKFEDLRERIANFASNCSEKLRSQHSCCHSVLVFIHTNYFRKDLCQYNQSVIINIPFETNSTIEIVHYALIGLKRIFKSGFEYKRAGVILTNFSSDSSQQLSLFGGRNIKHIGLMKTVDKINAGLASQKLRLGVQDTNRVWKMKQEKLSPSYTTNISDIITIKAI